MKVLLFLNLRLLFSLDEAKTDPRSKSPPKSAQNNDKIFTNQKKRISPKNEKIKEKNYLKVNFLQVDQVALVENGFWKPPAIGSLDIFYMRCLFCPHPAVGCLLDI